MMLACMWEICASPMRYPLRPHWSIEPPRANALDLLEDRTGARMNLEPRMTRTAPAKVLLHDAVHAIRCRRARAERHGQRDVAPVMKDARVVAELHVRLVDHVPARRPRRASSHDSNTSSMNIVRSRSGAGDRKCRFCQTAPPTVLGIPT